MQHHLLLLLLLDINEAAMRLLRGRRRLFVEREKWSKKWIAKREQLGWTATLIEELEEEDPKTYKSLLGVDIDTFYMILGRIQHRIRLMKK